ncbi:nucleoside 2-deoxyribosyltransferase [Streptomyces sp. RS10V-4]|uniref:nucleoside 2-deoxyribosyltransferase n=1 Tax=Streptomyces rhizoryzae TaxID=2932493 RepID=UPI002003CFBB|nr:nucleoside 2-deoxyribosyltransferase [Streptomyces rhizoryzae]MCK7623770.1 nucleoside 2-deoxyribosyltransferase [Streptomyces rhizoryzae]
MTPSTPATPTTASAPATAPLARELGVSTLFLAGPFLQLLDPATGRMPEPSRSPFALLIEHFEGHGFDVHNAHRREAWGAELMAPDECTRIDQEEIRKADVFVALPGAPASPGTHIEIGWASAFGKPVVLLLERGRDYTFLVQGLNTVATVEHVPYTDVAGALPALDAAVRRAVTRVRGTVPPAA